MEAPASPQLSASQLATLAEVGEERTASVGDVLYTVGDRTYPFIAIREGEVAILDATGNEIVRHCAGGFLGELNLLSGQTVFVTAVVRQPLRYVAVERDALRALLFEDGPLSDLLLSTFIARREALQTVEGIGLEIVGPHSSEATMRMLDFARSNRLPFTWHDEPAGAHGPLVRLPAARSSSRRRQDRSCARSESVSSSPRERKSTCWSSEAAPPVSAPRCTARPRAFRRLSSKAPRSADRRAHRAGSRTTSAFRPASPGPSSPVARSRKRESSTPGRRRRTARFRSNRATDVTWCNWTRASKSMRGPC